MRLRMGLRIAVLTIRPTARAYDIHLIYAHTTMDDTRTRKDALSSDFRRSGCAEPIYGACRAKLPVCLRKAPSTVAAVYQVM